MNNGYVYGNCYHSSEALYYILGGKSSGWEPMFIRKGLTPNGTPHWYLQHKVTGLILDPARLQFKKPKNIPYEFGKRRNFVTNKPSKWSKEMMLVLTWANEFKDLQEGVPE